MSPNKDRPSTWKKYDAQFCTQCRANCCSMPVEVKLQDLISLNLTNIDEAEHSIKKLFKRLKKEGVVISYREGTEFFMLAQRPNGDCLFLDERTRLCTVYDKRPETCRQFPQKMGTRVGYCPAEKK